MTFLIVVLILCVIYLWLIHPRMNGEMRRTCRRLARHNFAHRGLWSKAACVPENSMEAFRRAADAGYGIELDVQQTADGHLVVFHDDDLFRLCRMEGTIAEKTLDELADLRLAGTGHGIPLLSSVLKLVNGRVPLLIEIKLPTKDTEMCRHVRDMLLEYPGDYLIESFNPFGVRWFRKNTIGIPVGQLAARYMPEDKNSSMLKFLSTTLMMNTVSRPDFVAYDCRFTDVIGFRLNWKLFRTPVFVWTVRSEKEYAEFSEIYDGIIFERFRPPACKGEDQA